MSVRLCNSCRDWRKCPGNSEDTGLRKVVYYDYFTPSEIEAQMCWRQIIFVIDNLATLRDGKYPPDPIPSGYTGTDGGGYRAGAKFTRPAEVAAEFDRRLKRTGRAGKTLIHEVNILDARNPQRLSQTARDALWYCAGRDGKRTNFARWLAKREYRRRNVGINISPSPLITLEKNA